MPHDFTMPYRAANIAYMKKLFNHCLYLKGLSVSQPYYGEKTITEGDRQAVNAQWVLETIDEYNGYAGHPTTYGLSSYATKAIANKQFTDYCVDNGLLGRRILSDSYLSGDRWNHVSDVESSTSTTIPFDCIASISFDYSQVGQSLSYGMLMRLFVTHKYKYNNETLIKDIYLFGGVPGIDFNKYTLTEGRNTVSNISLNANDEIYVTAFGYQNGQGGASNDMYGVIQNLEVKIKLKTNEIYIPTPMTINTKNYYTDTTQEFPIEKSGSYAYSFFAYNGEYNSYEYNTDKIIKFSLINQNGAETDLYTYEKVPDEAHANYISNTIAVSAGSKFKAQCITGSGGKHGVIECLTIKGTI
jgi:hypothetical protein